MIFDNLNDQQIEAVRATEGNIRVIAGAGSGKTRVLAYRYAYIVNELGIDPANILCLTFTNKAAQEMRSRIAKLVSAGHVNDFVCTVHGFCVKFLRKEIHRIGYPKNFQILDEEDNKTLAKEVLAENNVGREILTAEEFLRDFGKWKYPGNYISNYLLSSSIINEDNKKELYVQMVLKQHKYLALDFHDLIYFTLHILGKYEDVRQQWQDQMNYVMVDETQDCNTLEWDIFTIISEQYHNLFIVGDPDQSIYEWRGGKMDLFLDFKSDKDIILDRNYRSTSTILDAANSIISNNINRIKKNLYTLSNPGTIITHFHGKNEQEESDWISSQVLKSIESGGKASDNAVLIRASYLSRSIEQSFLRHNISYVIWGGIRFFERKEIKDALSYLRLIAFDDDVSFKRIANVPSRKIGKVTMEVVMKIAEEQNCSLLSALKNWHDTQSQKKESIDQFISLIYKYRNERTGFTISDLLNHILKESGLLSFYRDDTEEERLENLNELINSVKVYEEDHKEDDITLEAYLQDVALYTNADYRKDKDQVKIMTIHQAKGLEFPNVFIAGLSEGIFPNRRSVRERKEKGMEEERRLMYVAVTRAEKALYLTESEGFSVQGSFNKYPSRFLREIQARLFVTEGAISEEIWKQADSFKRSLDIEINSSDGKGSEQIIVGSAVIHSQFGEGVVKAIYDDGHYCKVEFPQLGIRNLKKDKLSLKSALQQDSPVEDTPLLQSINTDPLAIWRTVIERYHNQNRLYSVLDKSTYEEHNGKKTIRIHVQSAVQKKWMQLTMLSELKKAALLSEVIQDVVIDTDS